MIQRILEPELPKPDEAHLRSLLEAFVSSVPSAFPIIDLHCDRHLRKTDDVKYAYVGGSWDCFGSAHVEYLFRVKEATPNCRIMVGVWADETVEAETGEKPLLMSLERTLAIVQCLHADGLIINASRSIPAQLARDLGIDIVVNEPMERNQYVQVINVPLPRLQTRGSLREKVHGDKHQGYIDRQKRKVERVIV